MNSKKSSGNSLRRALAATLVISVLLLGAVLWQHVQQQTPQELLDALPKQVDLALESLEYTHNEDGKRRWTLVADQAEYRRANGEALLDKVYLTVYEAGPFGELVLRAGKGRLRQEQQQVEVWGRVQVQTERQERLLTDRLFYDGRLRRLKTDEKFRYLSPQLELTGRGLEVDLVTEQMRVRDDVRALILPAQKGTTER